MNLFLYKVIKDKNGRKVYLKRSKTIAAVFNEHDVTVYFNGGSVRVDFDEAARLGFKQ